VSAAVGPMHRGRASLVLAGTLAAGCSGPSAHPAPSTSPAAVVAPSPVLVAPSPPPSRAARKLPRPHASGASRSGSAPRAVVGWPWGALARCESGGNWASTAGYYEGGLQFAPFIWRAFGGLRYAAHAYQATPAEQIAIARRVLASQGWRAWPRCSLRLGLR